MSKVHFSKQELAFFEEGDTLADACEPVEDFSDLEPAEEESTSSWVARALAVLSMVSVRGS